MTAAIKGWWFLNVNDEGQVLVSGKILDAMSEGLYLCQINQGEDNSLTHARVISAESMLNWILLPNEEEFKRFMDAQAKLSAPAAVTVPSPPPPLVEDEPGPAALRARALAEVKADAEAPKAEGEDPLSLPENEEENEENEEAQEYGFVCGQCEHPYSIVAVPVGDWVRANCPKCSRINKTAA
jgi:hypothetical protein